MQVILACTIFFVLQNIQEQRNHACIDQVGKHGADDGNDEEGLDGIAILIAHSTHVGSLYHIQFNTCHENSKIIKLKN